ncbi:MAG: DUF4239 domain-containing protein [Pseudolabrys sp.]|nr:DUF4239 domain-containing protein [Pseudolabrys sp.]
MIAAWLDLPSAGVFAVLIGLYGAVTGAIAWASFSRPLGHAVQRLDGVVPPFFTAIAILFALMTGFLANDIGDRNRHAARAVQTETAELRNVFTLSVASASDMREIRDAWSAYVKSVIADDWAAMESGRPSATAGAAFDALLREVSDPNIGATAGPAVQSALLNAAVRVGTARSERVALASDRTNDLKWMMVLLLGVMTLVAIGVVHLQRRNAQLAALTIFATSTVIALGLIGLQEHPFAGPLSISPAPLQELLKLNG